MPRPRRATVSGIACHVLNRRVMRLPIFGKPGDDEAFERILAEGLKRPDALGVLAYCLMPNHWHLVLWPKAGATCPFGTGGDAAPARQAKKAEKRGCGS